MDSHSSFTRIAVGQAAQHAASAMTSSGLRGMTCHAQEPSIETGDVRCGT
jgi:hypothetical protein